MPSRSVYIPENLIEKWDKIKDKSGLVQNAITGATDGIQLHNVPAHIISALEVHAKEHGISLEQLLIDEAVLSLYGALVKCPKCNWPLIDEREIPEDGGTTEITCQNCGTIATLEL
jgi:hypothetical protein